MVPDVDLSLRQFAEAWRVLCSASTDCALHGDEHADYLFSGLPIPFFNVVALRGRDLSAEALALQSGRARDWARERGVPWLLLVTHERLTPGVDATAALESVELAPIMPLTGMFADEVTPATRAADALDLSVPQDSADLEAMVDVNAVAYASPFDSAKPLLGRASFWDGHVPVLGRVQGQPASCAAVLMVDGLRYVALVATDPAHQRQGYAEAAMRRALEEAGRRHGARPTVLHATESGRPVYERMGYRPISNHTLFLETRFLEH